VWQVSAWPEEQVKYVQSVANPERWIQEGREGIQRTANAAAARVAAASGSERGPDDKWTVTLRDGEFFRIAAISRPQENPMLWWDPAGNPVAPDPRWSRNNEDDWLCIVFESSERGGAAYKGWEEGTPGLPLHGFSVSEVGTVVRIQRSEWEKAVEEGRDLRLTVGYEVGEWKERGEIEEGEEIEVDGTIYSLEEVKISQHANDKVHLRVDMDSIFHPDVAVGIGVVDSDGNMTPLHDQWFIFDRPSGEQEARYFAGNFFDNGEIDHFVLLTRLRDWKTFPKFALEPKGGL
jgi:hypothetical protein